MSDKPRRDRGQKHHGFDDEHQPFLPPANDRPRAAQPPRPPSASAPASPQKIVGTVKWFNATKGFGFIAPDDGTADIFLHINALKRSGIADIADGQRVEVEVVPAAKGLDARTVKIV